MNLVLLEAGEAGGDGVARVGGARGRHIREVLKAGEGATVRIGLVEGPKGTGTVEAWEGAEGVRLRCAWEAVVPERPRTDLWLAMPRPKVMRRLWAELAAVGVGRIWILRARKTERCYFDTHVLEPETVRAGLLEGLQQAKDTRLPEVRVCTGRLDEWLESGAGEAEGYARRWVAEPGAGRVPWEAMGTAGRTVVAIGPEGGWTENEVGLLKARGFEGLSLGERVLRSDTACVAALSVLHSAGA